MPRLLLCALALSVLSLSGGSAAEESSPEQNALHLLDRLGYGPRPGDLERVLAIGADRYLDEQLAPEKIPEPPALRQRLDALQTTRLSAAALFVRYGPPARKAAGDDPQARKQVQLAANRVAEEAMEARLLRAVYSPAQLQEVMTDFWFNHFNVFRGKGLEDHIWLASYERDAIRPYALGRFRELLGATAKHPAMLYYLDNWQSTVSKHDLFGDVRGGLNENYARELMELHTLGVDGGYTQKDVTELARILTGWTYLPRDWLGGGEQPFQFEPRRHDEGDKLFLGRRFAGDGQDEGERALDLLASSPATSRHIAFQLAQYFVADDPPPRLVEQLARRFQQTDGDIREVLRTLFHSAEFRDPANFGNKFKTPYQYVVSATRASGVEVLNFRPLLNSMNLLGMPLYGCQTPDGYKNTRSAWLNPDAMVYRLNFATALGAGKLPLLAPEQSLPPPGDGAGDGTAKLLPATAQVMQGQMQADVPPPDSLAAYRPSPVDPLALQAALGSPFSPDTAAALEAAPQALRASLMLGSPEFMRH